MECPKRKLLRLPRYDYSSAGYYFVTVCTKDRAKLFWDMGRAGLEPAPTNAFGEIVAETWEKLPVHVPGIRADKYVVMSNHFHGIIILEGGLVGAGSKPARTPITEIMRQFKTFSARKINEMRGMQGAPIWQRGYYDHVIRDEADYLRIWDYIDTNPAKWEEDEYYAP